MAITLLFFFSLLGPCLAALQLTPGIALPRSGYRVSNWSFIEENELGFVITEATCCATQTYNEFESNWKTAKTLGALSGAFHYYCSKAGPERNFENAERNLFNKVHFNWLVAVEFTENFAKKRSTDLARDFHTFLHLVEKNYNIRPLIRTNRKFWDSQIGSAGDDYRFGDYKLWAVDYEREKLRPSFSGTWKDYFIWEYAKDDHFQGVEFRVYFLLMKIY